MADILQAMKADAGIRLREFDVDGGAFDDDLLVRLQADLPGIPVIRPADTETTGPGSAFLPAAPSSRFCRRTPGKAATPAGARS